MRIKAIFYWPLLKSDVEMMVLSHDICQRIKGNQGPILAFYNPYLFLMVLGLISQWILLRGSQILMERMLYLW